MGYGAAARSPPGALTTTNCFYLECIDCQTPISGGMRNLVAYVYDSEYGRGQRVDRSLNAGICTDTGIFLLSEEQKRAASET